MLRRLDCDLVDDDERDPGWLTTLVDPPNPGPVRPEVARLPAMVLAPRVGGLIPRPASARFHIHDS